MPDPLMDTLDEIDRKSGKSGTFLLSPRVSPCLIRYRGTLLVTEGTSLIILGFDSNQMHRSQSTSKLCLPSCFLQFHFHFQRQNTLRK